MSTAPLRTARLAQAARLAGDTPGERALLAVVAADDAVTGARPVEEVRRLARRARDDGALHREDIAPYPSIVGVAAALIFSDELDEADRHLSVALHTAGRAGSPLGFALLSAWRSFVRLRLGEIRSGLADAEAAARTSDEYAMQLDRPLLVSCLGHLLREHDESAAAFELLEAFPLSAFMDAGSANLLLHCRGTGRLLAADSEKGLEDLLACGRHLAAWDAPNAIVLPWRSDAALVLVERGDMTGARRLIEEELGLARAYGALSAVGIALHALGQISTGPGRLEALREALAVLEGTSAGLARLRARISLGACLSSGGERAEAREVLSRALEDAERRVAELAATDHTNREIAEELFLTVRTVELHLTASYRKLGIRSRSQLPDELRR